MPYQQPPNARFWTYVNGGPVKLTIQPHGELQWSSFMRTEEGWESLAIAWEYDGDEVVRRVHTRGRDCDGDYETHQEDAFPVPIPDLVGDPEYPGVWYPVWTPRDGYIRDYEAEKAGY